MRDLIEAGADINHSNATNSTPLRAASYHNREEVIVYLLNQGADINIANQVGQAPVMISVLRERMKLLSGYSVSLLARLRFRIYSSSYSYTHSISNRAQNFLCTND